MTSEIRANTLKNRVGLGTVSFTNTGPVISGVTTTVGDLTVGSGGENLALGVRINSTYAQIKLPDGQTGANRKGNLMLGDSDDFRIVFDGHHTYIRSDSGDIYITNPAGNSPIRILSNDATEVYHASTKVLESTSSGISVVKDIDVDGHTNLDNVSIAGVSTVYGHGAFGSTVDITGDLAISDTIKHIGDSNTKIRFPANDTFTVETAGSERLRITSDGNVSIHSGAYGGGGTAPQLYVRGTGGRQVKIHNSNAGTSMLQITNGTTGEGEDAGTQLFTQGSTGDFHIRNHFATGDLVFATKPSGGSTTERLRIDSSGQVNIGNTGTSWVGPLSIGSGASGAAQVLQIYSNSDTYGAIFFGDATSGAGRYVGDISYYHDNNYMRFSTAGSERLRIGSNGEILTGGATSEPLYPAYTTARKVQAEIKGAIDVGQTRHHGSLAINCTNENATLHLIRSQANNTSGIDAGVIAFTVYDGTDFHQCARIMASRDATGGNNDTPGRLTFHTTADGASTATERLRIASDGTITKYYNSTSTPQFYLGGTSQVNGISGIAAASQAPLVIGRDSGNLKSIHCSGNIQMENGYGIDFSATGDASGVSSEVFDDYEEGSWTPSVTTGTSSVSGNCRYVKIGRTVYITGGISNLSNRSSSNDIEIDGLPFTCTSFEPSAFTTRLSRVSQRSGTAGVYTEVLHGSTKIYPTCASNGSTTPLGIRHQDLHHSAAFIGFTGVYTTSA